MEYIYVIHLEYHTSNNFISYDFFFLFLFLKNAQIYKKDFLTYMYAFE